MCICACVFAPVHSDGFLLFCLMLAAPLGVGLHHVHLHPCLCTRALGRFLIALAAPLGVGLHHVHLHPCLCTHALGRFLIALPYVGRSPRCLPPPYACAFEGRGIHPSPVDCTVTVPLRHGVYACLLACVALFMHVISLLVFGRPTSTPLLSLGMGVVRGRVYPSLPRRCALRSLTIR